MASVEIDRIGDSAGLKITEGRVVRREGILEAAAAGTKVVIYYADEGSQRVAHDFKAVP